MNGTYGKIVMQIDSNIDRIGQEVSSRKLLYVREGAIHKMRSQKRDEKLPQKTIPNFFMIFSY